jgi:hypothetical protein
MLVRVLALRRRRMVCSLFVALAIMLSLQCTIYPLMLGPAASLGIAATEALYSETSADAAAGAAGAGDAGAAVTRQPIGSFSQVVDLQDAPHLGSRPGATLAGDVGCARAPDPGVHASHRPQWCLGLGGAQPAAARGTGTTGTGTRVLNLVCKYPARGRELRRACEYLIRSYQ